MHFKHFTEPGDEIGKIFIGGLSWETTHDTLLQYFSQFGEMVDCVVMKNPQTGLSRGFGFVKYKDQKVADHVLQSGPHVLDGRQIDPKVCNPRHLNQGGKNSACYGKKIFLGGLPAEATEADLKEVFSQYGPVTEVVIMYDQQKQKSRGFGFLTFENEETVDKVCNERFISVCGRQVECKKAEPRDSQILAAKAQPSAISPPMSPKMNSPTWMMPGSIINTNGLSSLAHLQNLQNLQKEQYHIPTMINGELSEPTLLGGSAQGLLTGTADLGQYGQGGLPTTVLSPLSSTMASNMTPMNMHHSYASLPSSLMANTGSLQQNQNLLQQSALANNGIHCCASGASGPLHEQHDALAAGDFHNGQSMSLLGGMVPLLITMAPDGTQSAIGSAANGHLNNNLLQNAMLNGQLAGNGTTYLTNANAFMRMAPVVPGFHPYRRK